MRLSEHLAKASKTSVGFYEPETIEEDRDYQRRWKWIWAGTAMAFMMLWSFEVPPPAAWKVTHRLVRRLKGR